MSNETTILRFDFGDRPNEVRPSHVATIAGLLEEIFAEAIKPGAGGYVLLFHALPPRRGSIEFHFRPQINVEIYNATANSDWVAKAALGVSIATFFWTAVFGQDGSLHGALNPDIPKSGAAGTALTIDKNSKIPDLSSACAATGAGRVEIQIPDHRPVTLWDSEARRDTSAIGQRLKTGSYRVMGQGARRSVRAVGEHRFLADYRGVLRLVIVADVVEDNGPPSRAAVVLPSGVEAITQDIVAAVHLARPSDLKAIWPIPPVFDFVDGIFVIDDIESVDGLEL